MTRRLRMALASGAVAALALTGCSPVVQRAAQPATGRTPADVAIGAMAPAGYVTKAPKLSLGHGFVTFPGGADQWIARHPHDPRTPAFKAALGGRPSSLWLTGNESYGNLRDYVRRARGRDGTMVLTIYNIPLRWDGLSAPSKVSTAQYTAWVTRVAKLIGRTRAVLVLEPDALWFYDRLPSAAARAQRLRAIRGAARALHHYATRTRVYLDAGTASGSVTPKRMATVLRAAGLRYTAGYAVNVSSYAPTGRIQSYAQQIRTELHRHGVRDPRYVIDTGRNGNPHWDNTWCNPLTQHLGSRPKVVASRTGLDFRLWVKEPGTSDGDCGRPGYGKGSYGGEFLPALAYRMVRG